MLLVCKRDLFSLQLKQGRAREDPAGRLHEECTPLLAEPPSPGYNSTD